jgi:hypothetical protein
LRAWNNRAASNRRASNCAGVNCGRLHDPIAQHRYMPPGRVMQFS